jgi:3-keto-5-aminohexanoate cleavage enzyme
MKKLIIEVRVNEYAMRDENPNVPWTPTEIGREARAIQDAGASVIHFHARADNGLPAHGLEDYAAPIREIRAHSDLMINPTLGQITKGGTLERIAHIESFAKDPILKPEIVGLDPGSTNIDVFDSSTKRFVSNNKVYVNSHETLIAFLERFRELGVRPALACWNISFLRGAGALIDLGLVPDPSYFLLVHGGEGQLGAHPNTLEGLRAYTDHLPRRSAVEWSICCKGGNLFTIAAAAIAQGGHIAIGIGDYAYPELGYPTNAELVREIVKLAKAIGRDVATPAQARHMLGVD